jgi:aminopeptidase-like protein
MPNTTLYPSEARRAGRKAYNLAKSLFSIPRSLTGPGVISTLENINDSLDPELSFHNKPSGEDVCDWEIPPEWTVNDAYIETPKGSRLAQFSENPLHLVGYSVPVNKSIRLDNLKDHIYSLPSQPKAIPYVTSYYERRWGFCLPHETTKRLPEGEYKVFIDTELDDNGSLTYADCQIPGDSDKEILITTYICHPNLANNEISGPCVTTQLANWLSSKQDLYFNYRIVYAPETIGALAYIDDNFSQLSGRTLHSI